MTKLETIREILMVLLVALVVFIAHLVFNSAIAAVASACLVVTYVASHLTDEYTDKIDAVILKFIK